MSEKINRLEFIKKSGKGIIGALMSGAIMSTISSCSKTNDISPISQPTAAEISATKKAAKLAELKSKYSLDQIKKNGFGYKLYFVHPADQTPEQFFESTFLSYIKNPSLMEKLNSVFGDLVNTYMPGVTYNGNTLIPSNIPITMEIEFLPINKSQISQINKDQTIYDTLPILSGLSSSKFEESTTQNISTNGKILLGNSIVYDFEKLNNINPPAGGTTQLINLPTGSKFASSIVSVPVSGLFPAKNDIIFKLLTIARTNFHEAMHVFTSLNDNQLHNFSSSVQLFTVLDKKTNVPKRMLIGKNNSTYRGPSNMNTGPIGYTDLNGNKIVLPDSEILADNWFLNQTGTITSPTSNLGRTNILLGGTVATDKIAGYYIKPGELMPTKFELPIENRESIKGQWLNDYSGIVGKNIQLISDSLVNTAVNNMSF